jgi:hypothetical protein
MTKVRRRSAIILASFITVLAVAFLSASASAHLNATIIGSDPNSHYCQAAKSSLRGELATGEKAFAAEKSHRWATSKAGQLEVADLQVKNLHILLWTAEDAPPT